MGRAFLQLGLTAFGGPVAHLGWFRREFVERRQWLNDREFADLVALCQFLPGPASSQLGLALGWRRAGYRGAAVAWLGFTLPSALLMLALAFSVNRFPHLATSGWVQGLKIAVVVVVGQALWNMGRQLCPDGARLGLAGAAAACLILHPTAGMQWLVLAGGALAGLGLNTRPKPASGAPSAPTRPTRSGRVWLAAFFGLLLLAPLAARRWPVPALEMFDAFYRAGALVFGGGHVVLPLLEHATVDHGWLNHNTFLAGYGAAQALPGPLFAFAAYLGATLTIGPRGILGGLLALFAIYLPSVLILFGVLPYWERLRHLPRAQALLAGTNAAVVGLLAAAFFAPICTTTLTDPWRWITALLAGLALTSGQWPPWLVVAACALAGHWLWG